jgi:hypothetical protein
MFAPPQKHKQEVNRAQQEEVMRQDKYQVSTIAGRTGFESG